ncbi:hypothetical protein J5X84_41430 [Streptosporangiaceae bacterium NEAU-GS5]|nr:hypothetical protein [Streptosporangiaceae bacterium NEAU-GS5]
MTGILSAALATTSIKGIGRDAAGMPGTDYEFMTAWYASYTPALSSAVSLGDPRGPVRHPLTNITIGGHHYPRVDGMSVPGLIWKASMMAVGDLTPNIAFVKPDLERFGDCATACPS